MWIDFILCTIGGGSLYELRNLKIKNLYYGLEGVDYKEKMFLGDRTRDVVVASLTETSERDGWWSRSGPASQRLAGPDTLGMEANPPSVVNIYLYQ